jgi:hypothetical protein
MIGFYVANVVSRYWDQVRIFFFFYGPPGIRRCRRSLGKVRPLRWAPDHQSEEVRIFPPFLLSLGRVTP